MRFSRTASVLGIFLAVCEESSASSKWYETLNLRGYTQVRYNRILETNQLLKCEQCEKSWGEGGGFFIRRARVILSGDVHDRVYVYIQPDFASQDAGIAQLRD